MKQKCTLKSVKQNKQFGRKPNANTVGCEAGKIVREKDKKKKQAKRKTLET